MRVQIAVRLFVVALGISAIGSGCIPYAVGSTARPATFGETNTTLSTYFLPRALELQGSPQNGIKVGIDAEVRRGVSPQSDVGLRIASASGAIATYKRRLDGVSYKPGPGIAAELGGGFIGLASHGELEATVIVSGDETGLFTPYGGVRGVYTFLLREEYDRDDPVYGGFLGMRLGDSRLGVSAEVGVFRDRHQFQTDKRNLAIIPSVSFHFDILGWMNARSGRGRR